MDSRLLSLPVELQLLVLGALQAPDLAACCQVCSALRDVLWGPAAEQLWHARATEDFGPVPPPPPAELGCPAAAAVLQGLRQQQRDGRHHRRQLLQQAGALDAPTCASSSSSLSSSATATDGATLQLPFLPSPCSRLQRTGRRGACRYIERLVSCRLRQLSTARWRVHSMRRALRAAIALSDFHSYAARVNHLVACLLQGHLCFVQQVQETQAAVLRQLQGLLAALTAGYANPTAQAQAISAQFQQCRESIQSLPTLLLRYEADVIAQTQTVEEAMVRVVAEMHAYEGPAVLANVMGMYDQWKESCTDQKATVVLERQVWSTQCVMLSLHLELASACVLPHLSPPQQPPCREAWEAALFRLHAALPQGSTVVAAVAADVTQTAQLIEWVRSKLGPSGLEPNGALDFDACMGPLQVAAMLEVGRYNTIMAHLTSHVDMARQRSDMMQRLVMGLQELHLRQQQIEENRPSIRKMAMSLGRLRLHVPWAFPVLRAAESALPHAGPAASGTAGLEGGDAAAEPALHAGTGVLATGGAAPIAGAILLLPAAAVVASARCLPGVL